MFEALFHIVSIPKPTLPKTSCYKATEEHLLHLQRWGPGGAPTLRPMPVISTSCKPWGISTWVSIGVQCIAMHHLDMDSNMINDADIRKRGWGHCNWPVFQFHENMQKHIQCSAFLKYQRSNVVKSCKIMQVFGQKAWGPARRSWSHLIRTPSLDSMTETDPGYEESNQSGKSGISLFGLERSYQQKSIEIHRPTCLDANTRNHFLRNVQSCLGLGRLNLAKDAAYQRLALQHNSRFVLSQPRTNLNVTYWKKIYSCVEIARSCLGLTQWFRF
jgi:hypothetical protein